MTIHLVCENGSDDVTEGPRALPKVDVRYRPERHGDLHYEFPAYDSLGAWERRAAWLREKPHGVH